ncbi:helix-turn-helix transcriptional regulator [Nocardiopsis ansamitocini]|uniref:Helix-turn-helix domain-containing protein n=1 Tax=Nocardiopsis ansamitocini TaxID=1670832 RepID=A0A9W6PAA3_9ACTN|nr:helix-turn-helix domain-containing protein [Nocardiopsis ansamitocini]GLU49852.1 hypothetical protein Nans01_42030 [Nocardiopsis ansamitocini]
MPKQTAHLPVSDPLLTVPQVCAELGISRSTFYHWNQTGKGPRCFPLPNGSLRVRRSELNAFLSVLESAA